MTHHFWLDWGMMAVSLTNIILSLWLGLTVLFNSERRVWGIWLAGGGLLLGGAFFIIQAIILGYDLTLIGPGLDLWWRLGWIMIVAFPFAWYMVMLWYNGFWNNPQQLPQNHWGMGLTFSLFVACIGLLILLKPLPSFIQTAQLQLATNPIAIEGTPLLFIIYPIYMVLCIGLALNALRRPLPSWRIMGDQARRRAHPWLIGTSAILLTVSLLVAGIIFWIAWQARNPISPAQAWRISITIAWLDLIISGLITGAIILLGQAIVSYEVFTGKTLPRRELRRQWRNAIFLAIGYGVVVSWTLNIGIRAIYSLLLSTVLMTLFYGLRSWRDYTWRERYIRDLRPFVTSQHLYEHLITSTDTPPEQDMAAPFRALCHEVLGAKLGYLVAVGSFAPLVTPLAYPPDRPMPLEAILPLRLSFHSPQTMGLPLDPNLVGGAEWVIPLWSERGLIGLLLLGAKQDNGLYTQEEIEIARASGERLIDTRASAEIARRLMSLQRQRLRESQLLDRQTRRMLHDDILPNLHAALLQLGEAAAPDMRVVNLLTQAHRQIANLLRDMPTATAPTLARLGLVDALKWVVTAELAGSFDEVTWQIDPVAAQTAHELPPLVSEILFYATRELIRNAARHGRGDNLPHAFHLQVNLSQNANGLTLQVIDNGVGFVANGSGERGLALHRTMLAVVGGTLELQSVPREATCGILTLPQAAW